MPTTDERLTALEDAVAAIEGSMVSLDQVLKLNKLYSQNHSELTDTIVALIKRVDALDTNIRALNANRHNKRYELKSEAPVLVSGDTYELPSSYDPNALFLIFNPVVKVAESAITLAASTAVDPDSKRFDCTTVLAGTARVVYFERIPALTQPVFP